jgi:HEAT repeat protein
MKALLGLLGTFLFTTMVVAADVEGLIKKLKDRDPEVRRSAAKALGEAGPEAKTAVSALAHALKDSDLYVRRFAAQSLGEIGGDARAAVPALVNALNDPKREVVEAAASALGKMGKAGVEPLAKLVKDGSNDPEIRRKAVEALGELGADARAALPVLLDALSMKLGKGKGKEKPVDLRTDAATALGAIASPDDKNVLDALNAIANDKKVRDRTLKKAVSDALQRINSKKTKAS